MMKFVKGMGGRLDSADRRPEVRVLNCSYAVDTIHACTVNGLPGRMVPVDGAHVCWTAGRVRVTITNM